MLGLEIMKERVMRNRRLLLGASVLWMVTVSSGQVGEIARQLGLGTT